MILANASLARAILWRATMSWLGTRALVSIVVFLAGADPRHLAPMEAFVVVVITAVVAAVDSRRKNESALLANLGVHGAIAAGAVACVALLFEIVVRTVSA